MTHPTTPPPELVEEWIEIAKPEPWKRPPDPNVLCTLAAQWGADMELEACCEWLNKELRLTTLTFDVALRAARRPKPLSLKEQALDELAVLETVGACYAKNIRRALEQLDD